MRRRVTHYDESDPGVRHLLSNRNIRLIAARTEPGSAAGSIVEKIVDPMDPTTCYLAPAATGCFDLSYASVDAA
jgi:hypothetical protein